MRRKLSWLLAAAMVFSLFAAAPLTVSAVGPMLMDGTVYRSSETVANVRFWSNAAGTYYYQVTDSDTAPSAADLSGWTAGTEVTADTVVDFSPDGLTAGPQYVHIVLKDAMDYVSPALTVEMPYNYYYYEDFDVFPINTTIASNSLAPLSELHYGTGSINQKVIAAVLSSSPNMLSLSSTPSEASDQIVLLSSGVIDAADRYVFEGDVYSLGTNDWQLRFSFTNGSYESDNEAGVFFQDGEITTARGTGATVLQESFNTDQWYHVKIAVNPSANTYAVSVDGTSLNDSLPLPDGIDRLAITAGHGKTAYFDNLKFYTAEAAPSYGLSAPASSAQNGVTAAVSFSPESPVAAGTEVTATVTLSGTASAAGTHTVDLTSAKAGLTTNQQTALVTEGQNLTTTPVTKTFTFSMPGEAVDDFILSHTFAEADHTPPVLTAGAANRTSETDASVKFTSDEAGRYYYEVVEDGDAVPTIDTSGDGTACDTSEQTIALSTLSAGAKDIYIVVKDAAGNVSSSDFKIDLADYEYTIWDGGFQDFALLDSAEANSEANPYIIDTARKLAKLAQLVNGGTDYANQYFTLTAGIDLNELQWTPIGVDDDKPFKGNFDGGGHSVSGLYVNEIVVSTNKSGGLFGTLCGGTIKDLHVSGNVSCTLTWYASSANAGGIAGLARMDIFGGSGSALIDNCTFTGNVTASGIMSIADNSIGSNAGGITGRLYQATIRNCLYEGGNITADTQSVSGNSYARAGGITGYAFEGSDIINCANSSTGTVSAADSLYDRAGGIVGEASSVNALAVCYNTATISASEKGGIAGYLSDMASIADCYWIETCGADSAVGSQPTETGRLNQADMQAVSLCDDLNSGLDTQEDTSLHLWQQTAGSYPTLSSSLWTAPPPSGDSSGGGFEPVLKPEINTGTGTVTENQVENALKAVKEGGTISINVTGNSGNALIPSAGMQDIAARRGVLKIETGDAEIVFSPAAVSGIAEEASANDSIKFVVKRMESGDDQPEIDVPDGNLDQIFDISVFINGRHIHRFSGDFSLTLVCRELSRFTDPRVLHFKNDGTREYLKPSVKGNRLTISGRLTLSYFAIVDASDVPAEMNFSDVPANVWYHDAVAYAFENGLFSGTGDTTFSPKAHMTRGMLVMVLHRMAGSPEADAGTFSDTPQNAWYTKAAFWAAENEIVNGYSSGQFGPNDPVTREQLAAILYRYAEYRGGSVSSEGSLEGFSDGGKTSSWAADAMKWAAGSELITGKGNGILDPHGTATRAEVAAILQRLMENVLD